MRNDGANAITSATLNVKVNGTTRQYQWTGNLGYLDRESMAFGNFTDFTLADGKNEVELWLSDINGTEATSNTITSTFSHSPQATYGVQLKLYTDKKPEETTWKLYNSAGDVVREGGPYSEARKFITVNLELTQDDCYQLEFLDAGGDGITGANGNGYYQLFQINEEGKTTRITQGDYSGAVHIVNFNLTGAPQPKKRLVLFEEFTNTSCDPCAEFSPALDETIYRRMGDMAAITYHYNFPSPQDPFYMANTEENMARAAYYDVTGVPSLRVNGERVGAWGYEEYLDGYVTGAAAIPATVDLQTQSQLQDGLLVPVAAVGAGQVDEVARVIPGVENPRHVRQVHMELSARPDDFRRPVGGVLVRMVVDVGIPDVFPGGAAVLGFSHPDGGAVDGFDAAEARHVGPPGGVVHIVGLRGRVVADHRIGGTIVHRIDEEGIVGYLVGDLRAGTGGECGPDGQHQQQGTDGFHNGNWF